MTRVVIYPKDIQLLTGKSARSAATIMARLRKKFGKHRHQFITIDEFCAFAGLSRSEVEPRLSK